MCKAFLKNWVPVCSVNPYVEVWKNFRLVYELQGGSIYLNPFRFIRWWVEYLTLKTILDSQH